MKIDIRELVEAMFYHRHRKCVDLQEGKLVDDSVLFSGRRKTDTCACLNIRWHIFVNSI